MAKTKREGRESLRRVLMLICVLVLLGCIVVAACEISTRIQTRRSDDAVRDLYPHSGADAFCLFPAAYAEEACETLPAEEKPPIQDDFKELYAVNPDVVGWLTLGKSIDYPVVQSDNSFYLTHNFNQKSDSNGALFVNEFNSLWPRDDVLLIHGHNMNSGAMFGRLKHFESYDYVSQYPIVTFRTIYDAEDVNYVPFAAFHASMQETEASYFDVMQLNFEDDADTVAQPGDERRSAAFRAYLDSVLARSAWKTPVSVNETDEILVLLTCSYRNTDGRFLLFCRKLREDETPEQIQSVFNAANE